MVKGLYAAYEQGADTAILTDVNGNVSEGPGFNIFSINNGVVSTPDASYKAPKGLIRPLRGL